MKEIFQALLDLRHIGPTKTGLWSWPLWVPIWILNKIFKLGLREGPKNKL